MKTFKQFIIENVDYNNILKIAKSLNIGDIIFLKHPLYGNEQQDFEYIKFDSIVYSTISGLLSGLNVRFKHRRHNNPEEKTLLYIEEIDWELTKRVHDNPDLANVLNI